MPSAHASAYHFFRSFVVKASFATPVDLRGKQIIITGASPGSIGFETARILAGWGARVIVTTRREIDTTIVALRSASGGDVQGHVLDLTDATSVTTFVGWYRKTQGNRLDVLVNNAGVHLDLRSQWKAPQLTRDGFEIQWRTNYLGTMQLTHGMLPLLHDTGRKTGDARIVNVVSMLHKRGKNQYLFEPSPDYNSWDAYGLSKLALVHATFELQRQYAANHVQAYCLHPGAVFTNIAGKGLAENPVLSAIRNQFAFLEAFILLTPEEGAQTQVHCATSANLAGGLYYKDCAPATPGKESTNASASSRLWDITSHWLETLES
jgi:NAD(P)-dependent dehydrogenase (short-subunit alcohol dehydrogenase family)